jgi:hypothetical protein
MGFAKTEPRHEMGFAKRAADSDAIQKWRVQPWYQAHPYDVPWFSLG